MKTNNKIYKGLLLLASLAVLGQACKKYDNPPPVFEELKPVSDVQRKVIVISIDGVTGSELKTIAPPVITDLRKTSKYSYEMLKSGVGTDASSWVSIATGVSYSKHRISLESFERTQDPSGDGHAPVASYRNVLDYVTQYKATKTAIVTPWSNLRNYLRNADFAPIVSTDVAVKDSTVNLLAKQDNLGVIMVNLRDVEAAGANGGFVAANANYKNAILKADEYVGNILAAVKARKSYAKEDWLVIVTTNHGGSSTDPQLGFLMASNKNFKEEEVRKRGYNTVLFNGTTIMAQVPNDNGLYDSGASKDFTVQMQVKFNSQTRYPGFLSKGTGISGSAQTGWLWMQDQASVGSSWGGTLNASGANRGQVSIASTGADGSWHTLTMTIKTVNSTTRTVTGYMDGDQVATGNIAAHKSLAALAEKLTIGFKAVDGSGGANFQAANLLYFSKALDPAVVKANIALKDVKQHPDYASLIGYWPIDEGAESILTNKAPGGYDMVLSGPYTWKAMGTDVPPATAADPNAAGKSIVVTPTVVTANMLYWMKIKILPDFSIDGNPFLNQFELEFLK